MPPPTAIARVHAEPPFPLDWGKGLAGAAVVTQLVIESAPPRLGAEPTGSRGRPPGRPPSLVLVALAGYLGCAPICLRRVIESKYWRLSLTLVPSKVKKMAAGVSWILPEAGIVPSAVASGPVCVPFQVTSRAALLPLAILFVTVPTASGNAAFQPLKSSTIFSGPSIFRWVPNSS